MRLSWLENAYSHHLFERVILTHKVGQIDLVLVCDQGSLVGHARNSIKVSKVAIRYSSISSQTESKVRTSHQPSASVLIRR